MSSSKTAFSSAPHSDSRWWHSSSTTTRTPASRSRSTRSTALADSSWRAGISGSLPAATSRFPRATMRATSRSRSRAACPSQAAVSATTSSTVCPVAVARSCSQMRWAASRSMPSGSVVWHSDW